MPELEMTPEEYAAFEAKEKAFASSYPQDADGNFDIPQADYENFMDEIIGKPSEAPLSEQLGEGITGAGELAYDIGKGGIKATGNALANTAKTIGDTINFAGDAAGKFAEGFNDPSKVTYGMLQRVGAALSDTARERFEKLPPDQQKMMALKLVGSGVGGLLPGGIVLKAGMSTVGGALGEEAGEELGLKKDTPFYSKEKLEALGTNYVESVILPALAMAGGKGLSLASKKTGDSSVPIEDLRKYNQAQPGVLSGATTKGKNTDTSAHMEQVLIDGEKTLAKVVLDEFPDSIKNAQEYKNALQSAVTKRATEKKTLVTDIDNALTGKDVSKFQLNDVGYNELGEKIKRLQKAGAERDTITELKDYKESLNRAFSEELTPEMSVRTQKGFQEAQDVLDDTYKRMRRAQAFDDSTLAKAGQKPSAVAANEELIEVYKDIAARIKKVTEQKVKALEGSNALTKGTSDKLNNLNKEMHDLIPHANAATDLAHAELMMRKRANPGSLNEAVKTGNRGLISRATDFAAKPFNYFGERSRLRQQADFIPEAVSDMQQSSKLLLGREQVPDITPRGFRGGVVAPLGEIAGEGVSAVGTSGVMPAAINSDIYKPIPILNQMKEDPRSDSNLVYDEILKDPMSVEMLLGDPDLDPATVESFIKSKNFTDLEKNTALGKLKMEAAAYDKGWFPPSPMKGINSYIALPKAEYRGSKVLGVVTDPNERRAVLDAINAIPDVEKRTKMKSAFNDPNNLGYLIDFPGNIKAIPVKEKKPTMETKEVVEPENSAPAKIETGTVAGEMDRTVYDY